MSNRLIVFGDDGSTHADRAWLWINSQRWPGWSVDAVTAELDRGDLWSDDLPIELRPWQPEVPRHAFAESGIETVRHLRCTADPRLALESCDPESLLVIGPRGAHGLKQLLLGSTADHLLRHSSAPLVIAKAPAPATSVLVCTDGSPNAQHAVETFAGHPLARTAERIAVLGVATVGIYDDRSEVTAGVEAAGAALAAFEPTVRNVSSEGDVVGAVLWHAHRVGARLLVVGTKGRTGLSRIALGSTANALARAAACSVLVVPDRPADRPAVPI